MHASRKLQRINDGFKSHQSYNQSSKYNSKRDYERETSRSSSNYGRDRDCSPNGTVNGTYRSDSPDYMDRLPDRDRSRDHRDRDRDRYQSSSYFKMRDKDDYKRDYKKDKYSDSLRSPKRSGRDRDLDRSNHDRRPTSKYPTSDKRGNSDERDKERNDRDRGGDRDNRERSSNSSGLDRGGGGGGSGGGGSGVGSARDGSGVAGGGDRERILRIGDWSEHVSSSGKKYYYNCKTEVSQWEKPREWIEKERNLAKEQHRDYRDKDRCDRDRSDDRYTTSSSSSKSYGKTQQQLQHSNSRGNSRGSRWPQETSTANDGPSSGHRRRHDDQDMDISPGDSTPTSETSYSHSSTPTGSALGHNNNNATNNHNNPTNNSLTNDGPVLLASVLPRLTSNPSTTPTNLLMNLSSQQQQQQQQHFQAPGGTSLLSCNTLASTKLNNSSLSNSAIAQQQQQQQQQQHHHHHSNSTNMSSTASPTTGGGNSLGGNGDLMNSNAPGPPISMAGLPKILSQITGNKQLDQNDINPQKALQTINNALLRHDMLGNNTNSMRDQHGSMNSPLYNIAHLHSMSAASTISSYSSTTTNLGQTNLIINSNNGLSSGDPPTPTQESELLSDHRKLDSLASQVPVSSLQSVMTSSQAGRSQGPNLTPSLANYCRADLIGHITGWPADMLEKQAQKCSEEAHLLGDLQCSKVSTDLKCARSLVRITEITATLQEQKIMYLRQQIRRLEELKSKNSFMSGDL